MQTIGASVVGYDSNKYTGGIGARVMGIGPQTEWRMDVVTIGPRVVNALIAKYITITTEKTILSTNMGINVFKFYDMGTKWRLKRNFY